MNSHDQAMQALNGKRIYFVGDSITRYQYLELAYFAAHKRCPDPTRPFYVLSEAWFNGWDDFYASVSAHLEVETETHRTSEISMASRILLRPLLVGEHRTFHYEDAKVCHPPASHARPTGRPSTFPHSTTPNSHQTRVQHDQSVVPPHSHTPSRSVSGSPHRCGICFRPGICCTTKPPPIQKSAPCMQGRSFDLVYQQYFDETFSRLRTVLSAAAAVAPTDVVLNFGVWLRKQDAACGAADAPGSACPSVDWVCEFLHSTQHAFRVWWLATTPYVHEARIVQELPVGHPMNMQYVCRVPGAQVVDRVAVLAALEPDPARRPLLWWSADGPHFHADANHGFNQVLLRALARQPLRLALPWSR